MPLHTDRQDVVVFQTKGKKRWKVYPKPAMKRGVDPCSRGKAGDVVGREEISEVGCLDCVLEEGDVLYVPMGWAHETATPYLKKGEEVSCGCDMCCKGISCVNVVVVLIRLPLSNSLNNKRRKEELYPQSQSTLLWESTLSCGG